MSFDAAVGTVLLSVSLGAVGFAYALGFSRGRRYERAYIARFRTEVH